MSIFLFLLGLAIVVSTAGGVLKDKVGGSIYWSLALPQDAKPFKNYVLSPIENYEQIASFQLNVSIFKPNPIYSSIDRQIISVRFPSRLVGYHRCHLYHSLTL